jgi:pyridoxal phosphate enzyme (YggS family)
VFDDSDRKRLTENWHRTIEDVAKAAVRAGRSSSEVRIIGVSKYVNAETTLALLDAGCRDLGESRPQNLITKSTAISSETVIWHMIGHLQRNKARRVVEIANVIHSVDSLKLLESISAYANQSNRSPKVLIEVNISGEAEKHGFAPEQLLIAWPEIMKIKDVPIVGLMAMAGLDSQGDNARRQFAGVRKLRDTIHDRYGSALHELSMGMTGDFEEAISEGATMVRIGSRLFEGLANRT